MSQYVRVYYSILDDERFVGVYDTPHLATWLRLLLVADAMWPATAHLPAGERKASVQVLVEKGLVELFDNGRYRIHGLDAERGKRAASAAIGGRARQRSGSERSANAEQPLSLAEQSRARAEQSIGAPLSDDDGREDLEAWLVVKFRAPTPKQREFLDAYCRVFDQTGPARAARLILSNQADPIAALKADLEVFREERRSQAVASEAPKPKPSRGAENTKRYAHGIGFHDANPDPTCPDCAGRAA